MRDRRAVHCLFLAIAGTACRSGGAPLSPVPEADAITPHRLYLATLAAAELSLQMHQTDRAVHWLSQAPVAERGWEWRYLRGRSHQSAAVFPGLPSPIAEIAVSPNGRLLAVTGGGGLARLVDAVTGSTVHILTGHPAAVWSPAFSSDGRRLGTASSDGSVRIWDVATGAEQLVMTGNGRGVAGFAWRPGDREVAVSSWDYAEKRGVWGTLNVYDASSGERRQHLEHGGYPIASLGYSRDGGTLIGGTWDWNLLLWDTRTWAPATVLPPPESPHYKRLNDFDLSPDGTRVAAAYADSRIRIWNLAERRVEHTLSTEIAGQLTSVNDVIWLANGSRLASVGDDLTLRIWDAEKGDLLGVFHGPERPIATVASSPDGHRLYTGGSDAAIRVWDLEALDPARSAWPAVEVAYDVAFDPGLARAVVATWEGWLRMVDVATGQEIRAWRGHQRAAVGADWSPDGRWLVSTGNDGRVVLWDAERDTIGKELMNIDDQLESVAFSPDGALVAAPADSGRVRVWRVPSGEPVATLRDSTAAVRFVAWTGAGVLVASSGDGKVRLWNASGEALLAVLNTGGSSAPGIAIDPAHRRLAVAQGRRIRMWDLTAARWINSLPDRSAGVDHLAFSPDGSRIAAALSGNAFELWDAATGDVMLRMPGAASSWSVQWPRADMLVLVPLDRTIRVMYAPDAR